MNPRLSLSLSDEAHRKAVHSPSAGHELFEAQTPHGMCIGVRPGDCNEVVQLEAIDADTAMMYVHINIKGMNIICLHCLGLWG